MAFHGKGPIITKEVQANRADLKTGAVPCRACDPIRLRNLKRDQCHTTVSASEIVTVSRLPSSSVWIAQANCILSRRSKTMRCAFPETDTA